jgi:type IV secretory pathway VirB4 component
MAAKKTKVRQVNNNIVDVITPMAIEFNQRDFWFGENLGRIILITNYPTRVRIGWLSKIANMEGVTCSIHLTPTNPDKLIERINKSMGELGGRLESPGDQLTKMRAKQQYDDAEKLLIKIDQEQENVFYVTVSIMVLAREKDELERKSKKITSSLAASKMKGRPAMFRQEEALLSVSPYGQCPQVIKDIANRNMPVSTIAGAYPFNASGLNDGTGYIFGKDNAGGIVLIDTWRRGGDRTNSNWTILGAPGVGKSATVKHILTNEYSQGTKIIIIDPEREYKDLCKNLNGQWINCGGGKGGRINPLQVKDVPFDDDEEDEEDILFKDEGHGMGPLALHFQTLRTFFKLYSKDLDSIDIAYLEEILEELYGRHHIFWDTDTSKIPNDQYPILEELYQLVCEKRDQIGLSEKKQDRYDKIAALLRSMAVGADSALWNGHTTLAPNSDFIVLDTHNLIEADETIQRTQYFNILTWAWQQIALNRDERVSLDVDEGYLIVDPDVPQAIKFARNVSKRIRKYMGSFGFITHSAVDLLDPAVRRYGQALLDNPCFKFFMGNDGKALEELSELMNLTEVEQEMLSKKERGHGLLIAGSKRLHAKVELADFEIKLFGKGGGN